MILFSGAYKLFPLACLLDFIPYTTYVSTSVYSHLPLFIRSFIILNKYSPKKNSRSKNPANMRKTTNSTPKNEPANFLSVFISFLPPPPPPPAGLCPHKPPKRRNGPKEVMMHLQFHSIPYPFLAHLPYRAGRERQRTRKAISPPTIPLFPLPVKLPTPFPPPQKEGGVARVLACRSASGYCVS